jgi:LCP family protein required for cell wall assembly
VNRPARGRRIARVVVAMASCLVLVTTGYGWSVLRELSSGLTKSRALGSAGGDTSGPTNILIMGLDSRLDQNGNPLPATVLDQLHAGDSSNGGYNTNVLMLVHIPGGGQGGGPVGISIPRDDYVSLPGRPSGVSKAKIKEGYGLAKADAEHTLRAQGVTDRAVLERQGREAGRTQATATVEDFLGVRIDHFVEVTLVGFYDLAQALGHVTVCLQGPTQDSYSGAHFTAGHQQLDASQALAFVRQRRDYVHPELNFTDLDRARRQQAFLASAAYQLKSAGTLTNPVRLHDLIEVAAKDIVIDDGLDLLGFAQQAPALTGGGLSFTTLPVKSFDTVAGQAVNLVDEGEIKKVVHSLLEPDDDTNPDIAAATLPAATLDITNATGRDGLATTLTKALSTRGLTAGSASTDRTLRTRSTLAYGPDAQPAADALAALLPQLAPQPDPHLQPGHLRLVLGTDFTTPTDLTSPPGAADDASTTGAGQDETARGIPTSSLHTDTIPCVK